MKSDNNLNKKAIRMIMRVKSPSLTMIIDIG
jgi:hypothetical protein